MKFFRDILTGKDNRTYDFVRVIVFLSCVVLILLSVGETIHGHDFKPIEFASGICLLFGIGSGSVAIKARTEPEPEGEK